MNSKRLFFAIDLPLEIKEKALLDEVSDKYGVHLVSDVDIAQLMERLAPLQDSSAKELGVEPILARIRELK